MDFPSNLVSVSSLGHFRRHRLGEDRLVARFCATGKDDSMLPEVNRSTVPAYLENAQQLFSPTRLICLKKFRFGESECGSATSHRDNIFVHDLNRIVTDETSFRHLNTRSV
jgi:hypothetical protein